jgi:hypothetical protein
MHGADHELKKQWYLSSKLIQAEARHLTDQQQI